MAPFSSYTGETISCSNSPSAVGVTLMNLGLEALTSATLEMFVTGNSVLSATTGAATSTPTAWKT